MTDKTITIDDIIVYIKFRLTQLDSEIFDAKMKCLSYMSHLIPGESQEYSQGYLVGKLQSLRNEKCVLEEIMSIYYNGVENDTNRIKNDRK